MLILILNYPPFYFDGFFCLQIIVNGQDGTLVYALDFLKKEKQHLILGKDVKVSRID